MLSPPAASRAPDRLSQAGFADLATEYGRVQRIIGGRFGLVFQERGIQRLTYVGPPIVWRADPISVERGALAPFSVVQAGSNAFFLAQDGFYATDGAGVQPIGTQRVNKWFFENADQSRMDRVQGAVDWQRECVVWAFHSKSEADYDRLLIYSWAQNRWSTATIGTQWLLTAKVPSATLESLNAAFGTLEAVPYSLDSARFRQSDVQLSAFLESGGDAALSHFTGAPLTAVWETGEFQPSPGQRVFVSEVAPMMEAAAWNPRAKLFMRTNMGAERESLEVEAGFNGYCPVYGEGQKVRVRMTKPGGTEWSGAQGMQVRFTPAGYA